MTTFKEHLKEQLKDAEFKKEYESLRPNYEIIQALIDARTDQKIAKGLEKKLHISFK